MGNRYSVYRENATPSTKRHFKIEKELGSGTFGVVYMALMDDRRVVLKVIDLDKLNDHQLEFLENEIIVMEKITKEPTCVPYIICYYDHFEFENKEVLILEYFEGKELLEYQRQPYQLLIPIFERIAKGLEYIHDAKVAHRDIKPENILVDKNGDVRIIDFGFACCLEEEICKCSIDQIPGSVAYAALEIWVKDIHKTTDFLRTDIHALGVTFFAVANSRYPFGGDSAFIVDRLLATVPKSDTGNKDLDTLIIEMISPDASKRPTATQVAQRLRMMDK